MAFIAACIRLHGYKSSTNVPALWLVVPTLDSVGLEGG